MFQKDQPEANLQQALVSQPNKNVQSGVQKKSERRDYSLLQFCDSYCKPLTAAEQEASCKETTTIAVEKEADLCKKTTALAVEKTIEKEAGLCKKSIADARKKTMALEAKSCEKSIADKVNVEKEKEAEKRRKNSVMVEKVGPFKASKENKIGYIKKYYHNYEFSMDLRFAESEFSKRSSMSQMLVGIV